MSDTPATKLSPFVDCLANPHTHCGQQDASAPAPWICLTDWCDGWRPTPTTRLHEKRAEKTAEKHDPARPTGHHPLQKCGYEGCSFCLSHKSTILEKSAAYVPTHLTHWYVTFSDIGRANSFYKMTLRAPADSYDDAVLETKRLFQSHYKALLTAEQFAEANKNNSMKELEV